MESYSALSVAKFYADKSDWSLSNLQLQKMTYLSQLVWFKSHDEPLIDSSFEAWDYGPVVPSMYHKLKCFGSRPVKNVFRSVKTIDNNDVVKFLNKGFEVLSKKEPWELVGLTHTEGGAWAKHYLSESVVISNDDIKAEVKGNLS